MLTTFFFLTATAVFTDNHYHDSTNDNDDKKKKTTSSKTMTYLERYESDAIPEAGGSQPILVQHFPIWYGETVNVNGCVESHIKEQYHQRIQNAEWNCALSAKIHEGSEQHREIGRGEAAEKFQNHPNPPGSPPQKHEIGKIMFQAKDSPQQTVAAATISRVGKNESRWYVVEVETFLFVFKGITGKYGKLECYILLKLTMFAF